MFPSVWTLRMGVLVAVLTCSGCASIVSDNESTTYFATTPEKARCELKGQDFTRVVETPASVTLPAAAAPITVECSAENYRTMAETLDTSMDGWVLGNILFGGVIGAVIDSSRGAGQKYPSQYSMVLEPASFPTAAERDSWYDGRRDEIAATWSTAMEAISRNCSGDNSQTSCKSRLAQAETKRDAELAALEKRRETAVVVAAQ